MSEENPHIGNVIQPCHQPGLVLRGPGLAADHSQQARLVRGLGNIAELRIGRQRHLWRGREDVVVAQDAGPPAAVGDATVPGQRPLPVEPGEQAPRQSVRAFPTIAGGFK